MASRTQIAIRVERALTTVRDTLAKHDPESTERLHNASADGSVDRGAVPPFGNRDMVLAYLCESTATIAKLLDRQLQPRRRGRPPKHKSD